MLVLGGVNFYFRRMFESATHTHPEKRDSWTVGSNFEAETYQSRLHGKKRRLIPSNDGLLPKARNSKKPPKPEPKNCWTNKVQLKQTQLVIHVWNLLKNPRPQNNFPFTKSFPSPAQKKPLGRTVYDLTFSPGHHGFMWVGTDFLRCKRNVARFFACWFDRRWVFHPGEANSKYSTLDARLRSCCFFFFFWGGGDSLSSQSHCSSQFPQTAWFWLQIWS